jgi:hypothetical protein
LSCLVEPFGFVSSLQRRANLATLSGTCGDGKIILKKLSEIK